MSREAIEALVRTVLYEGWVLYPYRPSSLKNRRRWPLGTLYPRSWSDMLDGAEPFQLSSQFLVRGRGAELSVSVRFLQLIDCGAWQDCAEQVVAIEPCVLADVVRCGPRQQTFSIAGHEEPGRRSFEVSGQVDIAATTVDADCYRLTVRLANITSTDEGGAVARVFGAGDLAAQLRSLASAHAIATATQGDFVSAIDPPGSLAEVTSELEQRGAWPVLIGQPPAADTLLLSPIILYDYPRVAPESQGDFYDATEIDEMLSLRVQTLTDEEKAEARAWEPAARAVIERADAMSADDMADLHGAIRAVGRMAQTADGQLRVGQRVVLRPRRRADAFDIILAGKLAVIHAIEQDLDGRVQLSVVIDDDPGRDLGADGQVGHRFFFGPDEVEVS